MERLTISDIFGLRPARERLAQAAMAVRGDAHVPKTLWGLSSLRIVNPRLSISMWLNRTRSDRRTEIYNLFNRTQTPVHDGWSVRKTQVSDFRGGSLTYDSHNGTDFAVPVGTPVTAAADGVVIRVSSEFHRGGLKVFVDHGYGVVTSSNHLATSRVEEGDHVRRGEVIALAGASGIDNVLMFPWTAPHVHFNVFLNGRHADPYALMGSDEVPIWIGGEPVSPQADTAIAYEPATYDTDNLERLVAACRSAPLQRQLRELGGDVSRLGAELLFQTTYFATRFEERLPLYAEVYPRRELLSLPFREQDFVGAYIPPR